MITNRQRREYCRSCCFDIQNADVILNFVQASTCSSHFFVHFRLIYYRKKFSIMTNITLVSQFVKRASILTDLIRRYFSRGVTVVEETDGMNET